MHCRQPYSHKVQAKLFLSLLAAMMVLSTPLASSSSQQAAVLYQHDPAQRVPYFHLLFSDVDTFTYQDITEQSDIPLPRAKPPRFSKDGTILHENEKLEAMLKRCIYNGKAADGLVWVPQEIPSDKALGTFFQNKCFLGGRKRGRKVSGALTSLIFISFEKREDKKKVGIKKGLSKSFCTLLYQRFIFTLGNGASPSSGEISDSDDQKSEFLQEDREQTPGGPLGTTTAASLSSSDESSGSAVVVTRIVDYRQSKVPQGACQPQEATFSLTSDGNQRSSPDLNLPSNPYSTSHSPQVSPPRSGKERQRSATSKHSQAGDAFPEGRPVEEVDVTAPITPPKGKRSKPIVFTTPSEEGATLTDKKVKAQQPQQEDSLRSKKRGREKLARVSAPKALRSPVSAGRQAAKRKLRKRQR